MHNLRPEPAKRLGLEYSEVILHNPSIICAAAYGYRAGGPLGPKPAYDDIIQAACGLADLQTIVAGEPRYLPTMIADKTSSMAFLSAILAALFEKERSGMGQEIEVPMYESMVANIMVEHLYGETLRPASGELGYTRLINSQRRPYKTKDGYLALLPYTDRNWIDFVTVIGRQDLGNDARFADIASRLLNIEEYYALIAEIALDKTNQEWLDLLASTSVPHGVVNTLEDLLTDEQLLSTGFWRELEHPTEGAIRSPDIPQRFSRTPGSIRHLQPRLGEHSHDILTEAGFSESDIKELENNGITNCMSP